MWLHVKILLCCVLHNSLQSRSLSWRKQESLKTQLQLFERAQSLQQPLQGRSLTFSVLTESLASG